MVDQSDAVSHREKCVFGDVFLIGISAGAGIDPSTIQQNGRPVLLDPPYPRPCLPAVADEFERRGFGTLLASIDRSQ